MSETSANRILAAARRRFQRQGYRKTGIAEIAREAGVAAGTIYRHFASKEDLLRQVVAADNAGWVEAARAALAGPGTALERLYRLGVASVAYNQSGRLLAAVLSRNGEIIHEPLLEELHAQVLETNVAMMAEVIQEGVSDGSLRPVDPDHAAFVLFVAGRALFEQHERGYADVLPVLVALTTDGLRRRDAG